ncbi:hypothetical protein FKB34_11360 [Glycocaulis profundi]|nr:hypothetical protein FKB34_11360 [Glycocaulis profundi]
MTDHIAISLIAEGISPAVANRAAQEVRQRMADAAAAAALDPHKRMAINLPEDEITRLHDIAYSAALQTGAQDEALDLATSCIFRHLAAALMRKRAKQVAMRPNLRVVA